MIWSQFVCRIGGAFGASVKTRRVSEGSQYRVAFLSKNSWSHISFSASQFTIYPLSTGRRNTISPNSLHLDSCDPIYTCLLRSRAIQFGITWQLSSVEKPALILYAPLSTMSVREMDAGVDLPLGVIVWDCVVAYTWFEAVVCCGLRSSSRRWLFQVARFSPLKSYFNPKSNSTPRYMITMVWKGA